MAWTTEFYTDERGRAPVEEFLDTVPPKERASIFRVLDLLKEFGLQLGSRYVRHLEGKLWELRVQTRGKTYRILYFAYTGQRFILLHAFLKKTMKTPRAEIRIAQARLVDFLEREG
jgi:phage-related protein